MAKKIHILTIPGIGTKEEGYAEGFQKDVHKFTKRTALSGQVRIYECHPFSVTQIDKNQNDLYNRLVANNNLGGALSLRKGVLAAFGDGVTFERNASSDKSPYTKIHKYFKGVVENINAQMQQGDQLVIVASSMGGQILSTYIWDADHGKEIFKENSANAKNILRNLNYLATIGCNIPLFISGLPESSIVAFDKRNDTFEWDNYFDADDVLGWPLKQLSSSYGALVNDHEINTGEYVGSHIRYWDDNDFTKPFCKRLERIYAM